MIKILVVKQGDSGVPFYRSLNPHIYLQENYDNFRIDIIDYNPETFLEEVEGYNILHFHRNLGKYEDFPNLIKQVKDKGVVTVLDIDDWWDLPTTHPSYGIANTQNIKKYVPINIKNVDYVMTTTDYFAFQIKRFNKNVIVIPNAIDSSSPQFNKEKIESDKCRIIYAAGSSHKEDIGLLRSLPRKLSKLNSQLIFAGFDIRGYKTFLMKDGTRKREVMKPQETVSYYYENLMTEKYNLVSPEYKNYLHTFKKDDDYKTDEFYVRQWTLDVNKYATHYANADISLAPLVKNNFNKVKSQLKAIEAGFYKMPLIASNLEPYQIDIKHGKNGFLIDYKKNHKDWFKYLKLLINNPNLREDLGNQLFEDVQKYEISNVTKKRKSFYEAIVK